MADIKLKTARRETVVSRLAIRRAVTAAYKSRPSAVTKKAAKKAARKKVAKKTK